MHVSERLLQLYAQIDPETRAAIQKRILTDLTNGKSLSDSYFNLTGETNERISTDSKTANEFVSWLKDGKADDPFLFYYVAVLEHFDVFTVAAPEPEPVKEIPKVQDAFIPEPIETQVIDPSTSPKPRYIPETPVPSRSERAKFHQHIEPARPRRRRGGSVFGLLVTILLLIGGYVAYPYVFPANVEKEPKQVVTATPEPEPVVQTPEVNEVWIRVKNTSLLSAPDSTNVIYIGDIGDRYPVLEEKDNYVHLDLGVNSLTAWAPLDEVTSDWKGSVLSDPQLLTWIQTGVDQTSIETSVEDYLQMSKEELYTTLGEPYSLDADSLNEYAFYAGLFFVIQDGQVQAIDWTNTGQSKEDLQQIGEPTYETDDAVVYESEHYSLRLFVGSSGQTRIRVSEL